MYQNKIAEKGIVLPLVLLMVLVLVPIGLGLTYLIKPETRMIVKGKGEAQALQIADAGIKRAMAEIANDPSYTGPGGVQGLSTGQYTISVSTPGSTFEGSVLPDDRYGIEVVGYVPNMIQPRERKKIIALAEREGFYPFDFAITAGAGGVDIGDSCTISGDVVTSGTVTGASQVTGTVTEGVSLVDDFPLPTVPAGATDLGVIDILGNTNYVIDPGTYTCTSINIGGTAQITINTTAGGEPVYLYCSGDIDGGGTGFVNVGCDATTFFIYGTGTSGTINLSGTADVYAAIYAPDYDCEMSGTSFADGSVNVYSFTAVGTSDVQYEECLEGTSDEVAHAEIFSWREEKI